MLNSFKCTDQSNMPTTLSLEASDQLGQTRITQIFNVCNNSGTEKNLKERLNAFEEALLEWTFVLPTLNWSSFKSPCFTKRAIIAAAQAFGSLLLFDSVAANKA